MATDWLADRIQSWWDNPKGWCYVASEAYYHLSGGKEAGLTPMQGSLEIDGQRVSHWWLRDADGKIIDLTAEQFDFNWPYHEGRGRGFQQMKNDTKELIEWLKS